MLRADEVTILVKAFERPEALDRCLISLREFLPGVKIIVGDDSRESQAWRHIGPGIEYCELEHDTGLAEGRNILVRQANTPYVLIMDDDTVIQPGADLTAMIEMLELYELDVLGGEVIGLEDWKGSLEMHGETLVHLYNKSSRAACNPSGDLPLWDFIPNFFLAKRQALLDNPWRPELKICEHSEWSWRVRGKLDIGLCDLVRSANARDRGPFYSNKRARTAEFLEKERSIIGALSYDYVDPQRIRALLVYNPNINKHPMGSLAELRDQIAMHHAVEMVSEDQVAPEMFREKNLVISYWSWVGAEMAKGKDMRCVFLTDDLHWPNEEHLRRTLDSIDRSDLFFCPNAIVAARLDTYLPYRGKLRRFAWSVPWWFEPQPWGLREQKVTISGASGLPYPLRNGIRNAYHPKVQDRSHPNYDSGRAESDSYAAWLSDHVGGIATCGTATVDGCRVDYDLCKYYEVAAVTCPFFEENEHVAAAGFEAYKHYIPINARDWRYQVERMLGEPEKMREVFLNSSGLIAANHTCQVRAREFWSTIKEEFGWN